MKPQSFLAALPIAMVVIGCKAGESEKTFVSMAEKAPDFGSTTELSSLQGFMPGKWAVTNLSDPTFAKQLGVQAIQQQDKADPDRWYEFKADGRFKCGQITAEWQAEGHYAVNGTSAILTYETMAGRTIQEARDEYQKREESGRAVAIGTALIMDNIFKELNAWIEVKIAPDKKHLMFAGTGMTVPGADPNVPMGAIGLERMEVKKDG